MLKFAFFLKTYRDDFIRAKRLILSYRKYNVENLKLVIMCPDTDVDLFEALKSDNIEIISEKLINTPIFEKDLRWKKGYMNQEIYKLAFWELGLCENYQCLDSDAIFIAPFYFKDFMYNENIPYTVLVEDKELKADLYYYGLYWNARMRWIKEIENALNFHPYKMLTCHGFQVFSSKVLQSFKEHYLRPRNFTYKDIIEIAPYEFTWYNLWLQKTGCIPIKVCEPNFKTFHLKQHHINEVLRGMKIEDWARGYLGIIVNSNFEIGEGIYDDLTIYSAENIELAPETVITNYNFYRKILKERKMLFLRNVFKYVLRKVKIIVRAIDRIQ